MWKCDQGFTLHGNKLVSLLHIGTYFLLLQASPTSKDWWENISIILLRVWVGTNALSIVNNSNLCCTLISNVSKYTIPHWLSGLPIPRLWILIIILWLAALYVDHPQHSKWLVLAIQVVTIIDDVVIRVVGAEFHGGWDSSMHNPFAVMKTE